MMHDKLKAAKRYLGILRQDGWETVQLTVGARYPAPVAQAILAELEALDSRLPPDCADCQENCRLCAEPKIGARVRARTPVDRYPQIWTEKGALGTVVPWPVGDAPGVVSHGSPPAFGVKLDDPCQGDPDEWNNTILYSGDDGYCIWQEFEPLTPEQLDHDERSVDIAALAKRELDLDLFYELLCVLPEGSAIDDAEKICALRSDDERADRFVRFVVKVSGYVAELARADVSQGASDYLRRSACDRAARIAADLKGAI